MCPLNLGLELGSDTSIYFPDLQWLVGGVVLGVLGAARGLAHLPIPLGALMLLRLSPLSLQMAPANQIKTKLN